MIWRCSSDNPSNDGSSGVCDTGAQGIEKKFGAEPAIEKVNVSLKEKRVTLFTKDGQEISDEKIEKILVDSGFNVEKVQRK